MSIFGRVLKSFKRKGRDLLWKGIHRTIPSHKYHVIRTGLEPGYHEIEERMLYGMMSLLCSFVEDGYGSVEGLQKNTEDLSPIYDSQIQCEQEASAIYIWWTVDRPKAIEREEAWIKKLYSKEYTSSNPEKEIMDLADYEQELEDMDQAMLHRLIDIRTGLWI